MFFFVSKIIINSLNYQNKIFFKIKAKLLFKMAEGFTKFPKLDKCERTIKSGVGTLILLTFEIWPL